MAEEQNQAMLPEGEGVEVKDRGFFDFMKKDEEEKKEPCVEKPGEVGLEEGLEKMSVGEKKAEDEEKKEEGEEKKEKHGLLGKLHRSSSSSSSSSSDEEEEVDENGEKKKKKKGLKDKVKGKIHGDKKEEKHDSGDKKEEKHDSGDKKMVDEIKEKLPGEHHKLEEAHAGEAAAAPPPPMEECVAAQQANEEHKDVPKKGFLEKIKEKLPGQHKKAEEAAEAAGEKTPLPPAEECSAEQVNKEHDGEHKKGFLEKIKEKLPGHHKKTEEESPAAATSTQ